MIYNIQINDKNYEVKVERGQASLVKTTVVGAPAPVAAAPVAATPTMAPAPAPVAAAPVAMTEETIVSPLPGKIWDVRVNVGDQVKQGDVLCVIEAMKMENEVVAPCDGQISAVLVKKDDAVNSNDVLIKIGGGAPAPTPVAAAPAAPAPAPVAAPTPTAPPVAPVMTATNNPFMQSVAPAAAPAPAPTAAPATAPSAGETVTAPIPGKVWEVKVNVGDQVNPGDVLCTIEAMKMENEIVASVAGTVTQILVAKDTPVATNDTLMIIG